MKKSKRAIVLSLAVMTLLGSTVPSYAAEDQVAGNDVIAIEETSVEEISVEEISIEEQAAYVTDAEVDETEALLTETEVAENEQALIDVETSVVESETEAIEEKAGVEEKADVSEAEAEANKDEDEEAVELMGNYNNFSTAKVLNFNEWVYGNIDNSNTRDYYKITLNTSGTITFDADISAKLKYVFYDANYNEVGGWYYTTNITGNKIKLVSGTYYFKVEKELSGSYGFMMRFDSANETFKESQTINNNNFSSANTIELGKTINGQIARNDSADYYKFSMKTSGRILFDATQTGYLYFNLYDYSGNRVYGWRTTNLTGGHINLEPGDYYFVVSRDDNANYRFKMININRFALTKTKTSYTGNPCYPAVVVKDQSGNVIPSTSYTVTYKNNIGVGIAQACIRFKGDSVDSKVLSFTIIPPKSTMLSATPGAGTMTLKWRKKTNETAGYQIRYSTSSKFTSNVKSQTIAGNTKTSKTVKNLARGKKYYAQVRTYKVVNGVKYYSNWSNTMSTTIK